MSEASLRKQRPKFLTLYQIRFPLAAIVSILHRITGGGLFLLLPFLLYLLSCSLGSPESFKTFEAVVGHPLVKLLLLGMLWAYLHHFCMGIRFLLLDSHIGVELNAARLSAKLVVIVSVLLTIIIGVALW